MKKLLLGNELFKFLAISDLTQTRKLSDCSAVSFLVFRQNGYIFTYSQPFHLKFLATDTLNKVAQLKSTFCHQM